MGPDSEIGRFVTAAIHLMDRHCGLAAAYVVGSIALGDVAGAASDVDLLLVTGQALPERQRLHAGELLAEHAAASPLRGLEAVLYRSEVLRRPRHPLEYDLNVNAGQRMERSVTTSGEEKFWFLLDVAIARQHAIPILGPPAHDVIGQVSDEEVRGVLLESLRWHRGHATASADAALNACRALPWIQNGEWVSKTAAGEAYLGQHDNAAVRAAVALRGAGTDGTVDAGGVQQLHDRLEALLEG